MLQILAEARAKPLELVVEEEPDLEEDTFFIPPEYDVPLLPPSARTLSADHQQELHQHVEDLFATQQFVRAEPLIKVGLGSKTCLAFSPITISQVELVLSVQ